MAEPKRLTRQRLEALVMVAERGLGDLTYDIHEETGVWIDESEESVRRQIKEWREVDPGVGYTVEELEMLAQGYRRASAAIEILNRRLYPPREEEYAT